MHRMIRYLKTDFYRLFRSPQFYISIAGVFLIYMASSLQSVGSLSVFDLFYFIKFFSLIIGLFACSSFALAAMWLSLVAKNRMFAMCMPIAAYYILVNCIKDDMFSINGMYFFSGNLLSDPLLSFGCTVFVTACGVSIFMVLIYRRMRRMVRGVKR